MALKSIIKTALPNFLLEFRRKILRGNMRLRNGSRTVRDVFTEIYSKNLWGGKPGEYFSGSGSSGPVADAYCNMVNKFIKDYEISSVVDVGCGDFRVGSRIVQSVKSYIGIDIVEDLINSNINKYGSDEVKFICIDAISEELPIADLCLIRQVLQHLSNEEIISMIRKLSRFKYILVTEHFPENSANIIANKDKTHGADTRIYDDSAVVLNAAPFCIAQIKLVLSVPVKDYLVSAGEMMNTYLFSGNAINESGINKR